MPLFPQLLLVQLLRCPAQVVRQVLLLPRTLEWAMRVFLSLDRHKDVGLYQQLLLLEQVHRHCGCGAACVGLPPAMSSHLAIARQSLRWATHRLQAEVLHRGWLASRHHVVPCR